MCNYESLKNIKNQTRDNELHNFTNVVIKTRITKKTKKSN